MDKTMPKPRGRTDFTIIRRRRPLPKWKQAEEYFRQYRDPQLKVTLPKLKCLAEPRHG